MGKINLYKLIEDYVLDEDQLAKRLFPENKQPKMALRRVMFGDGKLDEDKIQLLSKITNIPIPDLFMGWSGKADVGMLVFSKGNYRAELSQDSWVTRLYYRDEILCEEVIAHGLIPLKDYLDGLDDLVTKQKLQ